MDVSNKIAEKARELFFRHGIRSITMDDIASQMGISKKTIYIFYNNKNSLVEHVVDKEISENRSTISALLNDSADVIPNLLSVIINAKKLYLKFNGIIYDLEKYHNLAYQKLNFYKNDFVSCSIKNTICRGIEQHVFQNDFDIDVISAFFNQSLEKIAIDKLQVQAVSSFDSLPIYYDLFACLLRSIATLQGFELIGDLKKRIVL